MRLRSLQFVIIALALMGLQACTGTGVASDAGTLSDSRNNLDWDPDMTFATPALSNNAYAILPQGIQVTPSGSGVPVGLAAYSGIWSGGGCNKFACDFKVAVEKVTADSATLVYAFASDRSPSTAHRVTAKYVNGDLYFDIGQYYKVRLGLRQDGVMMLKRVYRDGNAPSGALHSGWGLLAKMDGASVAATK